MNYDEDNPIKRLFASHTDLLAIILFTVLSSIFIFLLPDGNIIRVIFGIILLIFIPGYAAVSVIWPEKKSSPSMSDENLERAVLSLGLSIAMVSITGLVLNYTAQGISLTSTVFINSAVIAALSFLAYHRRMALPEEKRFTVEFSLPEIPSDRTDKAFVFAISAILIISLFLVAYVIYSPGAEERYTAFYILNENRTAVDYTYNLTVNEDAAVYMGIVNNEFAEVDYTVVAATDNNASDAVTASDWSDTFHLSNSTKISRNITLDNGEAFEEEFRFMFSDPGTYTIVWQLHLDGGPGSYELHLRVNVNPS